MKNTITLTQLEASIIYKDLDNSIDFWNNARADAITRADKTRAKFHLEQIRIRHGLMVRLAKDFSVGGKFRNVLDNVLDDALPHLTVTGKLNLAINDIKAVTRRVNDMLNYNYDDPEIIVEIHSDILEIRELLRETISTIEGEDHD